MNENSNYTPFSNRGVVNTINSDLSQYVPSVVDEKIKMCVDWCQATIFGYTKTIYDLFEVLFNINSINVICEVKSLYGYTHCYSFKDICIFCSSKRDDMGFHLLLTGSACRQVEDLGINFLDLFRKLNTLNCHYTRLDIAIDNFSDNYFSMARVKKCISKNCVVSRFRNSVEFIKTKLSDNSNKGYTIWFGSRASKIQIVFYDKLKERESQNFIVDENIKKWCRLEIRFRDEYATQVVYNLLGLDFSIYVKSLLANYIKFVEINENDTNRSRYKLATWWSDFLQDVSFSRLYTSNYQISITRKRNWLEKSTSRSNAIVLLSSVENLSLDDISCKYLVDYFNKGLSEVDVKDLQYINEYRVRNGFLPLELEDFKYLIGDIKDFLIERK